LDLLQVEEKALSLIWKTQSEGRESGGRKKQPIYKEYSCFGIGTGTVPSDLASQRISDPEVH
jgi:hypothetical protein